MRRHRHDVRYASDQRFQAYSLLQHVLQQQFWFSHENHHTKICRSADNNIKETVMNPFNRNIMNLFNRIKVAFVNLFAMYEVVGMGVADLGEAHTGRLTFKVAPSGSVPDHLVDRVFDLGPGVEPSFLAWVAKCRADAESQGCELGHCVIYAVLDSSGRFLGLDTAHIFVFTGPGLHRDCTLGFHKRFDLSALAIVAMRTPRLFEGSAWPFPHHPQMV